MTKKNDDGSHLLMMDQIHKVRALIRAECCNYDNGNCEILDDGEYHKCPQLTNITLNCNWFKEAVLPLDPALEAEISNNPSKDDTKHCVLCGKSFIPKSNRSKYCPKCAVKSLRKQQSEYARKKRSIVEN